MLMLEGENEEGKLLSFDQLLPPSNFLVENFKPKNDYRTTREQFKSHQETLNRTVGRNKV